MPKLKRNTKFNQKTNIIRLPWNKNNKLTATMKMFDMFALFRESTNG